MKVLIVDDDSLVRIGLKSIVNWQGNGFELIGLASDGSKALDIIKKQKPEIVITDIKMPVMDGLTLLKKLNELKIHPKILVLSSYSDFHLVKEAMKLGAEDYLLKLEIEPEYLISVLKKISQKIEECEREAARESNLDIQITRNLGAMKKNFLRDILNRFYSSESELKESMDFFDIQLNGEYIYCIMIKIGELYRFENVPDEELHVLNLSIINISEEIINEDFRGYCFEGKTGEYFVLASDKRDLGSKVGTPKLISLSKRLNEILEHYLNVTATIAIGEGKGGIKGIHDAYNRALSAMKYRFFKEDDAVILWKETNTDALQNDDYSILNIKENLHKALSFHQKEELETIFSTIKDDLSKLPLSRNAICNVVLELFYMVSEFFELYQINTKDILKQGYRTYQQLVHIESITDAKKWLDEIKADLINYIKSEDEMPYSRIISRVKKYIEDHFNQEISLKEVADEVSLNPSYFSTIFKKFTGMSYTEYTTQVRIEKAKVLLEKSNYKVYEVGEQVGYQNIYYFNRIFKKVVGVSPGEFKKKVQ